MMNLQDAFTQFAKKKADVEIYLQEEVQANRIILDANEYCEMAENLGFEDVGVFAPGSLNPDDVNGHEMVCLYARPDGLLLSWYESSDRPLYTRLTFQLKTDSLPGNGYFEDPEGKSIFVGFKNADFNLASHVFSLQNAGQLQSPFPFPDVPDMGHFCITGQDYLLAKKESVDYYKKVDAIQTMRLQSLPVWVKQMMGIERNYG